MDLFKRALAVWLATKKPVLLNEHGLPIDSFEKDTRFIHGFLGNGTPAPAPAIDHLNES